MQGENQRIKDAKPPEEAAKEEKDRQRRCLDLIWRHATWRDHYAPINPYDALHMTIPKDQPMKYGTETNRYRKHLPNWEQRARSAQRRTPLYMTMPLIDDEGQKEFISLPENDWMFEISAAVRAAGTHEETTEFDQDTIDRDYVESTRDKRIRDLKANIVRLNEELKRSGRPYPKDTVHAYVKIRIAELEGDLQNIEDTASDLPPEPPSSSKAPKKPRTNPSKALPGTYAKKRKKGNGE